ncbi:hypothetical protein PHG01_00565 [Streptococcus mutans PKUSS-HG01]|jgi:hypothetical protein|nr:hypothetical protein PHG01_00565 [Streptococcus mutans PKUSS-HG01]
MIFRDKIDRQFFAYFLSFRKSKGYLMMLGTNFSVSLKIVYNRKKE